MEQNWLYGVAAELTCSRLACRCFVYFSATLPVTLQSVCVARHVHLLHAVTRPASIASTPSDVMAYTSRHVSYIDPARSVRRGHGRHKRSQLKMEFHGADTDTDTDSPKTATVLRPMHAISSRGSSQGCRRVGRVGVDVRAGDGAVECELNAAVTQTRHDAPICTDRVYSRSYVTEQYNLVPAHRAVHSPSPPVSSVVSQRKLTVSSWGPPKRKPAPRLDGPVHAVVRSRSYVRRPYVRT